MNAFAAYLTLFLVIGFVQADTNGSRRKRYSVPDHDLNVALRQANDHFSRMQSLENNLKVADIDVEEKSPSHGQLIDSLPSAEALLHGNTAQLVNWASAYLIHSYCRRHQISKDDCIEAMTSWSLNTTSLRRKCTIQFGTVNCGASGKYRTFDGACNHPSRTSWGQAYSPYKRLLPPAYADGISQARSRSGSRKELPSARLVSSALLPDLDLPDKVTTLALPQWGQFVANDLFHTVFHKARHTGSSIECCRPNGRALTPRYLHPLCMPVSIPAGDSDYSPHRAACMNYVRSVTSLRSSCNLGPADQMNQASHFLDGSMLYGNSLQNSISLRSLSGGRLASSVIRDQEEFLPLALAPELQCQTNSTSLCYRSGDSRVNVHPHQTTMYTVWMREHNRIADALSALNPHWEDKKIFMEARRIVVAQIQHITYNAWLPVVLGEEYYRKQGLTSTFYDEEADPTVSNAVATAGFGFIHSLLQKEIKLYDVTRKISKDALQLQDHFNKPDVTQEPGVLDSLVRGLTLQRAQKMDASVVDDVTSKLYKGDKDFGLDVVSLDIQRGRDHGLPSYSAYRKMCNFPAAPTFDSFMDFIPKASVNKLASVYALPEDVDLAIGLLLETPSEGAVVGPTLQCLLSEQFFRTRAGDRYFYDTEGLPQSFTKDQLLEMKKSSLARVLCDNAASVHSMQVDVFRAPSAQNQLVDCADSRIPTIQLTAWKDAV